jgi:hypothetical protein
VLSHTLISAFSGINHIISNIYIIFYLIKSREFYRRGLTPIPLLIIFPIPVINVSPISLYIVSPTPL